MSGYIKSIKIINEKVFPELMEIGRNIDLLRYDSFMKTEEGKKQKKLKGGGRGLSGLRNRKGVQSEPIIVESNKEDSSEEDRIKQRRSKIIELQKMNQEASEARRRKNESMVVQNPKKMGKPFREQWMEKADEVLSYGQDRVIEEEIEEGEKQQQQVLVYKEDEEELRKELFKYSRIASEYNEDQLQRLKDKQDMDEVKQELQELKGMVSVVQATLEEQNTALDEIRDTGELISESVNKVRDDIDKQTKILTDRFDDLSSQLMGEGCYTKEIRKFQESIKRLKKTLEYKKGRKTRKDMFKIPSPPSEKVTSTGIGLSKLADPRYNYAKLIEFKYDGLKSASNSAIKEGLKDYNKFPCPLKTKGVKHSKECVYCHGSGFLPSDYIRGIIDKYNELGGDTNDMDIWKDIEDHVLPKYELQGESDFPSEEPGMIRKLYLKIYCAWKLLTMFLYCITSIVKGIISIIKEIFLIIPRIGYDVVYASLGWICCIGPILASVVYAFLLLSELVMIHKIGQTIGIGFIVTAPFRAIIKGMNTVFALISQSFDLIRATYSELLSELWDIIQEDGAELFNTITNSMDGLIKFVLCSIYVGLGGPAHISLIGSICEGYHGSLKKRKKIKPTRKQKKKRKKKISERSHSRNKQRTRSKPRRKTNTEKIESSSRRRIKRTRRPSRRRN